MQQLSIGAVAEITQIPPHTLRKWETRHGIAIPTRTATGRRLYSEAQVEELKLIKHLVGQRHSLAELAGMDLDALRSMADLHAHQPERIPANSVRLIGPAVQARLGGNPWVVERFPGTLDSWRDQKLDCASDTLIIDADILPSHMIDTLIELQAECAHILVIYRFASRAVVRKLETNGVTCIRAPANDDALFSCLARDATDSTVEARPSRFSSAQLARIGAQSPSLDCECPNHIAQLIMDITSFERYSKTCVDTDPGERALHEQLTRISGQARVLFEEALIAVAVADGIKLEYDA